MVMFIVQETDSHWFETKESLELEVSDAKIVAPQKTAEASRFLSKIEETQGTMKETNIMINVLLTTNETMKLEIERLKKERDSLTGKYQQYENLEKQFALDLAETRSMVLEMDEVEHGEPQWINCDIRTFRMDILGQFGVIMADPPWDIHMELPYGTMADDEMRSLSVPILRTDGLIFLGHWTRYGA
ncbi:hypothetical protein VitviT2T_004466 [Vitis vinifera]|uniref:N6-adenosine-methyltransferase MT-A70-like n=1 Tax=Vitis vinifera TaxID=29760 RepID=A0ABY9BPL3_VITVI|nr:hypothetical protein VitviT2T_004466 [Vitis vinifera]